MRRARVGATHPGAGPVYPMGLRPCRAAEDVMAIPQRPFGPTGAQVPSLGQGTWNMEFDASGNHLRALMCGIDACLFSIFIRDVR